MSKVQLEIPPKLIPVFGPPRGSVTYRGAYGGRGGAKSRAFASVACAWGISEPLRILCTREYQVSIKESFHAELRAAVESYEWMRGYYDVGVDYLRGSNGTQFLFRGLQKSGNIKSLAGIDLTIVEEAEQPSEQSIIDLEPTVLRVPKSEMWFLWNPEKEGSPVDKRLRKHPPVDALVAEINYPDNPWFPDELEKLRARQEGMLDPATYAHIWEGAYLLNSDAQVLNGKWRVEAFEPGKDWDGPYHGIDWGFSQDPLAATKCWIFNDRLWIEREAGGLKIENDDIARTVIAGIPDIDKYEIGSDNARPETISYVIRTIGNQPYLPRCIAAKKWPGSVEDGISHLRGYKEIIIHPRCKETKAEARLWSYKVDKQSGQVMRVPVKANDNYWDSIRYALGKVIRKRNAATPVFGRHGSE